MLLPLIAPGVATGALFAFATSFDELVVAIFVSGPQQFTLPRQMYAGLREFLSPTIASAGASSSCARWSCSSRTSTSVPAAESSTGAGDPAEPN